MSFYLNKKEKELFRQVREIRQEMTVASIDSRDGAVDYDKFACYASFLKSVLFVCSNWPTFPQIFIKGEFIGGSDIILNMHQVTFFSNVFSVILDNGKCLPLRWFVLCRLVNSRKS